MNYVRCVNNKAYVRVPDEAVNGNSVRLNFCMAVELSDASDQYA